MTRGRMGRYFLVRLCGRGRYGICFIAEREGRLYVLKRFRMASLFGKAREAYRWEAQVLSALDHPRIPKLVEVVSGRWTMALVLEHKPGRSLKDLLYKDKHVWSPAEIYSIGLSLLGIISYVHDRGVVHGDISPANVLLSDDGVSLVDFGLSHYAQDCGHGFGLDFSYFGDLLLHLLYSSYTGKGQKGRAWFDELELTPLQVLYLKRLLRVEEPFCETREVVEGFKVFRVAS